MTDPFGGAFGGFDPRMFEQVPLFRELQRVMSWSGGPVNWDLASQTAGAIATDDSPLDERDVAEFTQAVQTAELWLDQVTELPAVDGRVRWFSQTEWVRQATSRTGLGVYMEPVAEGMGQALAENLPEELSGMTGDLPQVEGQQNPMSQAMGAMGAMMYGMQAGTIAGHLGGQLLSTYSLSVPIGPPAVIGPVGRTAERFASDYQFDPMEFRHWLALSEAAHRRMFAGVPWLTEEIRRLVGTFASQADFDPESLFRQMGGSGLDPNDPEAVQKALEGPDAFEVEPTTAQQQTLSQLQTLVSFTEAWTDTVLRAAASDKLTALPRIEEAIRRRRAEHGPGERFLNQLVGLDLSPGDVQKAQAFCDAVLAARGQDGLDRVWESAEYLPRPDEVTEPSRWLVRMAAAELEAGDET